MNTISSLKDASACFNTPCLPSLQKIGFKFYQEQTFENGLISLPAFTGIRISYLRKGSSRYEGTLCAGDLLLSGFTSSPLYGEVSGFHMASVVLHFTLFYRLTGITPKNCRSPLKISSSDQVYSLLLPLFYTPQEQWEKLSLSGILCTEKRLSRALIHQMECVDFAVKTYHSCPRQSFMKISEQMGVSYRQLQRDFQSFLGLTPTEYERADRFQCAVKYLKNFPPAQAALLSGYWDQAHMVKEFKEFSGRTPRQITYMDDILLPQPHITK